MKANEDNAKPLLLRCAVPAPLFSYLDYTLPEGVQCGECLTPGIRVQVPLGKRQLTGILIETHHQGDVPPHKLRPATALIDQTPLIDPVLLELLRWTAAYYLHPVGETTALALSLRERRGEQPAPSGEPGLALNQRGRGLPPGALKRAKKQAQLLSALQHRPHTLEELEQQGISRAVIREFLAKDLATREDIKRPQDWFSHTPLEATPEQQVAIDSIRHSPEGYRCHLLEGITGSGKTEVYLQVIADVIAQGKQVLILLPEIGLTPQMINRFAARFHAPLALLHSGLADGERDRNWSMARAGDAAIVLGTRSAVFVPMARLGLIVVDEEHDGSFSQQDGLRYSARDVAVKRAHLADCPIILGSATPSLESLGNADSGRYRHHRLTRRAGGAQLPTKAIIDVRGLALDGGVSPPLKEIMSRVLAKGEQVLLFINRRGFAPALLCHDCGWVAGCEHCDARLTLHRHPAALRCHHCNHRRPLPVNCPSCHGRRLVSSGLGTEQTEQILLRNFANTPIYRVDSDSMSGRDAMAKLTRQLEQDTAAIILGTQMLTKGHHFPRVTCVGIIDADTLLFNPDFRGEERLLQLLTQVGGRAGRAERPGQVVIQTHHPEHPLIQSVLDKPYDELARGLLQARHERGLPPAGALAVLRCDSRQQMEGLAFLEQVRQQTLSTMNAARLIGPLPAPMARRAGLFRSQLVLTAPNRSSMSVLANTVLRTAQSIKQPSGLRWFMDVDPTEGV